MRFSSQYEGAERKLFTLFNAASDNSLAFHSYLMSTHVGQIEVNKLEAGMTLSDKDITKIAFRAHKTNFHKSGIITGKDKAGQRAFKDGKSMEFQRIPDAITLFVFQPCELEKYPIIKDKKSYIEITSGNKNILPPNIQVILAKKQYNWLNDLDTLLEYNVFINPLIFKEQDLDLIISIRRHKNR